MNEAESMGVNDILGGAGAAGARPPGVPVPRSITIIGIGNTLMGDDGFGIFVVEGLSAETLARGAAPKDAETASALPDATPDADVKVIAGDTAGMALLKHFLNSDVVIVVDALDADAKPGSIYRFNPDEAGIMNLRSNNIHGMGVPHLVTNARLKGADPGVIVFAVQVESVNPRYRELSPAVAASVERVRQLVADEVARLLGF